MNTTDDMQMDLFGGETAYVSKRNRPAPVAAKVVNVQLGLFEVEVGSGAIYTEPEMF